MLAGDDPGRDSPERMLPTFQEAACEHTLAMNESPSTQHEGPEGTHQSLSGRWAGWLSVIALIAILTANILTADKTTGALGDLRIAFVTTFSVCGIGAFILSIRALMQNDRRWQVWASLAFGLAATLLTIAEFTIME